MEWTGVPQKKHKGKTLPQIAFHDPYYLMWLITEATLYGPLVLEADKMRRRVSRIILKGRKRRSYEFAWDFDPWEFRGVYVALPVPPKTRQPRDGERTQFLDLGMLKSHGRFAKADYKLFRAQIIEILFGDPSRKMTKKRCEGFFNNPRNFGRMAVRAGRSTIGS
jgi:hypothetical protein